MASLPYIDEVNVIVNEISIASGFLPEVSPIPVFYFLNPTPAVGYLPQLITPTMTPTQTYRDWETDRKSVV